MEREFTEQELVRREKAQNIRNLGMDPFGHKFERDSFANDIKEKYNIPVYLKNDVKCSSLCEKKIGSIKDYENALFLTLGTGIGGAYFYKNEQMIPNTYQGMEIGHMIIDVNGKKESPLYTLLKKEKHFMMIMNIIQKMIKHIIF